MIGSVTLGLIAASFVAFLGLKKFAVIRQEVPLRVVFEGSASGLHKGGGVNFGGIRVGEVISLKLDKTRRVVALTRIDKNAPIRKDTLAGLEFQGLTGIAAISLTGGSLEADPVPLDVDGIPVLTADPDALLDTQTKIRVALRNVDKVIADNREDLKDALLGFETFTASLANSTDRIDSVVRSTVDGVNSVDSALTKTQSFLDGIAGGKSSDLLPTVISYRELIESFNKRSGALMSEGRRMLGDVSQAVNKSDQKRR